MYLHINAHLCQSDEEASVSIPAGLLATEFNNFIDGVFLLMIPIVVAHDNDNCDKVLLMLLFYLLESKINNYCERIIISVKCNVYDIDISGV